MTNPLAELERLLAAYAAVDNAEARGKELLGPYCAVVEALLAHADWLISQAKEAEALREERDLLIKKWVPERYWSPEVRKQAALSSGAARKERG